MPDALISLSNDVSIPAVGLGLWKIPSPQAPEIIRQAIQAGYRHLDGACDYGNEAACGEGVRQAIQAELCHRDDLWVTSKLWNTYHRPEHVELACKQSLKDWGLDYFDLYLIHFPIALRYVPIDVRYPPGWTFDPTAELPCMVADPVPIIDTWRAMEELVAKGLVRNIGISNFGVSLIRDLLSQANIRPAILQIESHPYLVQEKLVRYCQQESIGVTAFSPLGAGSYVSLGMATPEQSVLNEHRVMAIARHYNKTPAQVILRWGVQRGASIVPKSTHLERLRENIDIFDFELTAEEMKQIASLDRGQRFNDPGVFCQQAFNTFFPIYE